MSDYWIGWSAGAWGTSWGYDSGGVPIEVDTPALQPGGHWKHLFKRAESTAPPLQRASGHSRVAFLRPETTVGRESVGVVVKRVTGAYYVGVVQPTTGCSVSVHPIHAGSRVARLRVRGSACLYTSGIYGEGRAFAYAAAGAMVVVRSVASHGYSGRCVVKTVQNPTEEMLLAVL